MERSSGILMPISSLPSKYGIGTVGRAAFEFADFLKASGQSYWQVLPLNPTSFGDSPYQSFSSFAGNPYFVDPGLLIEDGLLTVEEADSFDFGSDPEHVDYGKLYENRFSLLHIAFERGFLRDREKISGFVSENSSWLLPYARFMALKRANGMKEWLRWDIKEFGPAMEEDRDFFIYIQYLFFMQWDALKSYVNGLGIKIIGDIPIYVALDSADCWSEPDMFRLSENSTPSWVSGVPPDYFSEDGQLWGNPLYDYEEMAKDGFGWWIRRIGGAIRMYDLIRIDHFRGFASYWCVKYGERTARKGHWEEGPGMELVGALTSWFGDTQFIAEDLGTLTEDVYELMEKAGLPGMRVLEFAFDESGTSTHLPYRYDKALVCYTGTHDNAPVLSWEKEKEQDACFAREYFGAGKDAPLNEVFIKGGMASSADLFIAPMQDVLGLSDGARMNTPGTPLGNWTWRMREDALGCRKAASAEGPAAWLARMSAMYGRGG